MKMNSLLNIEIHNNNRYFLLDSWSRSKLAINTAKEWVVVVLAMSEISCWW